jgi:hypothetical protein
MYPSILGTFKLPLTAVRQGVNFFFSDPGFGSVFEYIQKIFFRLVFLASTNTVCSAKKSQTTCMYSPDSAQKRKERHQNNSSTADSDPHSPGPHRVLRICKCPCRHPAISHKQYISISMSEGKITSGRVMNLRVASQVRKRWRGM